MKSSKLCALCDNQIEARYVVCREHYPMYQRYKDEPWFQMLATSQRRQHQIDKEELRGVVKRPHKRLEESEKKAIAFFRMLGLGSKSISKVLKIPRRTVIRELKRISTKYE